MTDTTFRFRPFHIGTTHRAGPDSADPTIEICEFETFGEHTRRYVVAHVFTDETDAALIAAAPELYEALERLGVPRLAAECFCQHVDTSEHTDDCTFARHALAKVRGEHDG